MNASPTSDVQARPPHLTAAGISFRNAGDFIKYSLDTDNLPGRHKTALRYYYRNWRSDSSDRIFFWYNHQLRDMERLIEAAGRPRILDAGSGTGTESLWFALLGADVLGIDVDEEGLDLARTRLSNLRDKVDADLNCRFAQISILDIEEQFDLIWLEQAFHHMEPRAAVVQKLSRLLRPNGCAVFSETNAWNPFIQAALFRLRGTKTIIENLGVTWGHERILTPGSLARQLERVGLSVEKSEFFRIFPSGRLFNAALPLERALQAKAVQPLLVPFYTHYSLIARKPEDSGPTPRT